ncbi:MAG TPA: hypothetical protein VES91_05935, partial [Burkholderiaceae bacterium]|nr:hypothetical protein [Burkholderiaceae bacterium]
MSSPTPPPASVAPRRRSSTLKMMFWLLVVPVALIALYFGVVLNWNYSAGERAGWVQKLSRKGWLCKTWEGEMAMVSMPGAIPEKFLFTVRDDAVAESINKVMGKRVMLHYEEKVGLPTSCFGETRHFVTGVLQVEEIPLVPGVVVPSQPAAPAAPAQPPPGAPATSPSMQPAPPPSTTVPPPSPAP